MFLVLVDFTMCCRFQSGVYRVDRTPDTMLHGANFAALRNSSVCSPKFHELWKIVISHVILMSVLLIAVRICLARLLENWGAWKMCRESLSIPPVGVAVRCLNSNTMPALSCLLIAGSIAQLLIVTDGTEIQVRTTTPCALFLRQR